MMANNYYQENPDYISQLIELPRGISRLEELGVMMSYPKNQIILEAGEIPKYCYVVKRGCIAGFEYTLGGQERIYTLNRGNSVVLEANLVMNFETPVSFKAIEPTEVIAIDRPTLMNMISSDPEIAMDILQSVSVKFLSTMEQLRHTNYHSAEWKICDLLLDFARKYGTPYDDKILI
ncbi:MAG: Crp/Fnr family transcriptional regulator, partial [Erysipelotrichaceae bacterium]|nr:Crp/Fnr family transcriptional regulator [Erysipelotrichaceae bacterium]